MMDFVTDQELEKITGYKAPYKQIEWLNTNSWPFIVNAASHPVVHRTIMLIKLGVYVTDQKQEDTKSTWKPDLAKVN